MSHLDDDIQDAFDNLERADTRLRAAWESRISDPGGLQTALDEYNTAGQRLASLLSQRFKDAT